MECTPSHVYMDKTKLAVVEAEQEKESLLSDEIEDVLSANAVNMVYIESRVRSGVL